MLTKAFRDNQKNNLRQFFNDILNFYLLFNWINEICKEGF